MKKRLFQSVACCFVFFPTSLFCSVELKEKNVYGGTIGRYSLPGQEFTGATEKNIFRDKLIFSLKQETLKNINEMIKGYNEYNNNTTGFVSLQCPNQLRGLFKEIAKGIDKVLHKGESCLKKFFGSEELDKNVNYKLLKEIINNFKVASQFYLPNKFIYSECMKRELKKVNCTKSTLCLFNDSVQNGSFSTNMDYKKGSKLVNGTKVMFDNNIEEKKEEPSKQSIELLISSFLAGEKHENLCDLCKKVVVEMCKKWNMANENSLKLKSSFEELKRKYYSVKPYMAQSKFNVSS